MLKKDGICYKLLNSTTIELNTHLYISAVEKEYEITKLSIRDTEIKLGDTFKFPIEGKNIIYTVNYIRKITDNVYLLHTELRNKTTKYILPILDKLPINSKNLKILNSGSIDEVKLYCPETYLINAYVGAEDENILEGYLYLKFKFSTYPTYQILEESIIELHPLFVKMIDKGDSYTYFKFVIPKEYLADIKLFLKGKYSEMSLIFKKKIISFYRLNSKSNFYQILFKKDEFRFQLEKELGVDLEGLELDSIPEIEKEILKL